MSAGGALNNVQLLLHKKSKFHFSFNRPSIHNVSELKVLCDSQRFDKWNISARCASASWSNVWRGSWTHLQMKHMKIWTTWSFTFARVKWSLTVGGVLTHGFREVKTFLPFGWCRSFVEFQPSHGGRGVSVRCRGTGSFGLVLWVKTGWKWWWM